MGGPFIDDQWTPLKTIDRKITSNIIRNINFDGDTHVSASSMRAMTSNL